MRSKKETTILRTENEALEFYYRYFPEPPSLFDDRLFRYASSVSDALTEEILRIIFHKSGIERNLIIYRREAEHAVSSYAYKEVRFDFFAEMLDGSLADIEIQRKHRDFDYEREDMYSSILRTLVPSGIRYRAIKPVYLIILNENNPFPDLDEPIYISGKHYGGISGSTVYYDYPSTVNIIQVNGDYLKRGDELGNLLISMKARRAEDAVLPVVKDILKGLEDDREKERLVMTLEEFKDFYTSIGKEQGFREGEARGEIRGEAKGRADAEKSIAEAMRRNGISEDDIKKYIYSR